jgi:hypothetical protein
VQVTGLTRSIQPLGQEVAAAAAGENVVLGRQSLTFTEPLPLPLKLTVGQRERDQGCCKEVEDQAASATSSAPFVVPCSIVGAIGGHRPIPFPKPR